MNRKLILVGVALAILIFAGIFIGINSVSHGDQIETRTIQISTSNDPRTDMETSFNIDVPKEAEVVWTFNNETFNSWNFTYVFENSGSHNISVAAVKDNIQWIGNTTVFIKNNDQERELTGGTILVMTPGQPVTQRITFTLKPSSNLPEILFRVDLGQVQGRFEIRIESFYHGNNGGSALIRTDRVLVAQDYVYEPEIMEDGLLSSEHKHNSIEIWMEFTIYNGRCDSWSIFGSISY